MVGLCIRKARIKAGLKQKELAAILKISESRISQYESGLQSIRVDTLQKIANALNVSIKSLVDDGEKALTIAENIKQIRRKRGMTQKELGELCGINEVNIHKYEYGKQKPKIETIERIAKALGVSCMEIMDIHTRKGDIGMESKQEICTLLLKTLQATDNASDLVSLQYDPVKEIATAVFASGGKRVINVAMDSGTAMIRDIMKNLGC